MAVKVEPVPVPVLVDQIERLVQRSRCMVPLAKKRSDRAGTFKQKVTIRKAAGKANLEK